jgi:hypothetical protein
MLSFPRMRESIASPSKTMDTCLRRYDSPHLNVIPADAGIHIAALVIARKEGHD